MAKKSCELYPKINGETSKTYKDLLKLTKDRQLTNYIYAVYLQQGVSAQMDSKGFKKNKQGQHSAKDIMQNFDLYNMMIERVDSNVNQAAKSINAVDVNGNLVDYTDAKNALAIAQKFNETSKGAVAAVYEKNGVFNIIVSKKDISTQVRKATVEKQLKQWDIVTQAFNDVGIYISNLDSSIINPINAESAVKYIESLKHRRNKFLSKNEIKLLLRLNDSSQQVNRLKQMFGTIDEIAEAIYNNYKNGGLSQTQEMLIESTLNNAKKVNGLNFNKLINDLKGEEDAVQNTEEGKIQKTFDDLNKKFHLNKMEIEVVGNEIKSLTDLCSQLVLSLKRQLQQLKAESGVTQSTQELQKKINKLMQAIETKQYYAGLLDVMSEVVDQFDLVLTQLQQQSLRGVSFTDKQAISKTLIQYKNLKQGYENILKKLTEIDKLDVENKMTQTDKDTLKQQATKLLEQLSKNENLIQEIKTNLMTEIAINYLGDKLSNGIPIVNLIAMADKDSSWMDYLYSISNVSNPLIATMGNIIRDAQDSRDAKMNAFSTRIQKTEDKLRKAGFKSDFMYEEDGYIISDIDWKKYNKEKYKYQKQLKKQGFKGIELDLKMKEWVNQHTEQRLVDSVNNRYETVPDSNYRKQFPNLTPAQQEYYDTMMQIKGEIGTLLPHYAQHHYFAPQIRRSFNDAWIDAFKHGSIRKLIKTIRNKIKDDWTIREDDTNYAQNGIINGENTGILSGTLDNTPYRQIPIFFVNKIKDQSELLKDFSSAVQQFAGTAVNYEAMYNIKDTIEFMGDFISDQEVTYNNNTAVDLIEDRNKVIFKKLFAYSKASNTQNLINSFIAQHIYGQKIKDTSKLHILFRNLLQYTSVRSLALNLKGAISNYLVGELQMIIEAGGGEFFGLKDYAWANAKVFGDNTVNAPGRIMDFVTNNTNSKAVLLARLFDPLNENFEEQARKRYHRGLLRSLLGKDFTFIGYGAGEHMIHYVTMYAILNHEKVTVNGQKVSLYDIFKKGQKEDGNTALEWDKTATYTDENGVEKPIDEAYFEKIRKRIRYANHTMHGSMNTEDKGVIHQRMLGRFVMNLRQWMVEHYSRRYRGTHFDATLGEFREGYYKTTWEFMLGLAGDIFNFERESMIHWKDMNTMQKSNVRRALSELLVLSSLLTLSFALGDPDRHKREFWYRMWIYQTKRAIVDVNGSTPWGIPSEMGTLINSPIAATNVVNSLLYPVMGLDDIDDTIKKGKHKGENKYWRNIKKYTVPFYGQIEQIQNFDEDNAVFQIFEKSNMQK